MNRVITARKQKINVSEVFVAIFALIVFLMQFFMPVWWAKVMALGLLAVSWMCVVKMKTHKLLMLMFLLIFYFNYSIAVGEYLFSIHSPAFIDKFRDTSVYAMNSGVLLLFMATLYVFLRRPESDYVVKTSENSFFYMAVLGILLIIAAFGLNRSIGEGYTVAVTPLYEYSFLLMIFLCYFAGVNKTKIVVAHLVALILILQDFMYGGRITSAQIGAVLICFYYLKFLTPRRIALFFVLGMIGLSVVGAYRSTYSLDIVQIGNSFVGAFRGLFVFDTVTYANAAGITIVSAAEFYDLSFKLEAFFAFLGTIFVGGDASRLGNVTMIANELSLNLGGGILPTHFYFWGGVPGVLAVGLFMAFFINKLSKSKGTYAVLLSVAVFASVFRWYIYSPTALLRGAILVFGALYFVGIKLLYKNFANKKETVVKPYFKNCNDMGIDSR